MFAKGLLIKHLYLFILTYIRIFTLKDQSTIAVDGIKCFQSVFLIDSIMFHQSIKLSIKTTKTDDESKQINNQSERNYTETRFDANWLSVQRR